MFRSEKMALCEVVFTDEATWDTMNTLANAETVMFTAKAHSNYSGSDLRGYAKAMIKRCEELQGMTKDIEETLQEFNLEPAPLSQDIKTEMEKVDKLRGKRAGPRFFEYFEEKLRKRYQGLSEHVERRRHLKEKLLSDLDKQESLNSCKDVIPVYFLAKTAAMQTREETRLQPFFGLIPTENMDFTKKLFFRMSRNNVIFQQKNLDTKGFNYKLHFKDDMLTAKTLIFMLCPSGESQNLHMKIERILRLSGYEEQDIPFDEDREEMQLGLAQDINDTISILERTNNEIFEIIENLASPESRTPPQSHEGSEERHLNAEDSYELGLSDTKLTKKGKLVDDPLQEGKYCSGYAGLSFLNMCKLIVNREMNFAQQLVYVEKRDFLNSLMFWAPQTHFNYLEGQFDALELTTPEATQTQLIRYPDGPLPSLKTAKVPTLFKTNSFTAGFQDIVDTYGIPRYREANPAIFTIVTFPFFFGLMFGDVGHGSIVLLTGLLMLIFVKDPHSSMYRARWMIFFMGFFAVYCGFIYSEWFANPFAVLKSCYLVDDPNFAKKSENCTYPFGFDYVWYISENETSFLNSFKMKFSIIIGVLQMLLGVFLKGMNGCYFGRWEDVIFEAIPQAVFMLITFGYMSLAIVVKWLINWTDKQPVSIIQMFINFTNVQNPLFGDGQIQQKAQTVFLLLCVVCFVVMLVPKPIIVHCRNKKNKAKREKQKKKPLAERGSEENVGSNGKAIF